MSNNNHIPSRCGIILMIWSQSGYVRMEWGVFVWICGIDLRECVGGEYGDDPYIADGRKLVTTWGHLGSRTKKQEWHRMSDSCFFWTQEPIGSSGEEGTDPLMRRGCANHVFIGSSIIQGYVNAIQTDTSGKI